MGRAIIAIDDLTGHVHRFVQMMSGRWRHDIDRSGGGLFERTVDAHSAMLCCRNNGFRVEYDSDGDDLSDETVRHFSDHERGVVESMSIDPNRPIAWWVKDWSRREAAVNRRGRRCDRV